MSLKAAGVSDSYSLIVSLTYSLSLIYYKLGYGEVVVVSIIPSM